LRLAPWQVWWVDFGDPVGHEQRGVRPGVVVGSDFHCRFPIDMALVIPMTTQDRRLPHHVPIGSPESGLTRPSFARTEDVKAISTRRFRSERPIGVLSEQERAEVSRWVHRMLA